MHSGLATVNNPMQKCWSLHATTLIVGCRKDLFVFYASNASSERMQWALIAVRMWEGRDLPQSSLSRGKRLDSQYRYTILPELLTNTPLCQRFRHWKQMMKLWLVSYDAVTNTNTRRIERSCLNLLKCCTLTICQIPQSAGFVPMRPDSLQPATLELRRTKFLVEHSFLVMHRQKYRAVLPRPISSDVDHTNHERTFRCLSSLDGSTQCYVSSSDPL